MNLVNDPWIPVIRTDGRREKIAPWQLAETCNPVLDIDAPRPDFQGALYQFLIGLLQTAFVPEDIESWIDYWEDGAGEDALKAAFGQLAGAFELYNPTGPAFMQDFDLPDGEVKSVAALLIDSPGGKTVKDNLDFFVKRDRVTALCAGCAATALFTLQINAPSGGVGHRVSLRGGGPLTCLVLPKTPEATLWQKLWLNVLDRENAWPVDKPLDPAILTWLAPTLLSDKKGTEATPDKLHPLAMYWSMPRRIRLEESEEALACDICGETGTGGCRTYRTKNYGINYDGEWLHPLTPYRFDPKKKKLPLSLKGQQGGLGYRHWLGLTLQDIDTGDTCAKNTRTYVCERAAELGDRKDGARLWCFGFDMDNMKARCWYDHTFPLFGLSAVQRENMVSWAADLIRTAKDASKLLRTYVKAAWFHRPADVKGDISYIEMDFWQRTETQFLRLLHQLSVLPEDTHFPSAVYKQWLGLIGREVFAAFDQWSLESNPDVLDMKRIVAAKVALRKKLYNATSIKTMKERAKATQEVD